MSHPMEEAVSRNWQRSRHIIKIVLVISVIGHSLQILNFWSIGQSALIWPHVASLLVVAASWWGLARYDAVRLVWWVVVVEFVLVSFFHTMALGPLPGFMIYPLIATGVATAIPFDQEKRRFMALCGIILASFVVLGYVHSTGATIQLSVDELETILVKNLMIAGFGISVVMWYFSKTMARAEADLHHEYQRSEGLLHNMLPVSVAERLKSGQGLIADHHEEATVLFADISGFTERASRDRAEDLVQLLKDIFACFDTLTNREGVEKVKTIGDAYMVVIGVTETCDDHASTAVSLARDMMDAVSLIKTPDGQPVKLRIGIHSGPVIAGVIGEKRMAFDLWGDTVNTASRMESTGVVGRIQISEAVARRLPEGLRTEKRGLVKVKGKGEMETWLVA